MPHARERVDRVRVVVRVGRGPVRRRGELRAAGLRGFDHHRRRSAGHFGARESRRPLLGASMSPRRRSAKAHADDAGGAFGRRGAGATRETRSETTGTREAASEVSSRSSRASFRRMPRDTLDPPTRGIAMRWRKLTLAGGAEGNAGVDAGRTERDARPLERRKARNEPRAGRRRCLLRSAWPAHAAEPAPARALARVAAGGFARRKNSARCRSPKKAGSREVGTGFRGPAFLAGRMETS